MTGCLGISLASESVGSINGNGLTNWLEVTLPCSPASVSNGSVNTSTCVITCNTNYTLNNNSCVANEQGGGGWWGWGGGWATTCTLSNLVCTAWKYSVKEGINCIWGQLNTVCSATSSTINTWNTHSWFWGSIIWSTYSSELNDAYIYAFWKNITTMPTIQEANMEWNLIRSHMAKMIVNYTIKVLKKTVNTWAACDFNDIQNETPEMKVYIKLACQLGIMGIQPDGTPMQQFNPNNIVTRTQFGTVLSRVLRGDTYNDSNPYYVAHLNALKQKWIMNKIENAEWITELRGLVMLMLMRSANQL